MSDTFNNIPSAQGFSQVIDFDEYLQDLYDRLIGKSKMIPAGKSKQGDVQGNYVEQDQFMPSRPDVDMAQGVVNDFGANYIVGEIAEFMNKHGSMGDMFNDQRCRRLAADITNNIVCEIGSSPTKYGCSEEKLGMLDFRMKNVTRSLYMFFTAVKGGKILAFGEKTTGAQQQTTVDASPPGVVGGLLGRR